MWHKYAIFALILLIGIIGIGLKLIHADRIDIPAKEKRESVLKQTLGVQDIVFHESFNLNYDGSFVAYMYRHVGCEGGWLITAMPRNSEAVNLFERQAAYKNYNAGPVFYILEDQVYSTFPDWNLWFSQKMGAIKNMIGLHHNRTGSVFAVRGFGACVLPYQKRENQL